MTQQGLNNQFTLCGCFQIPGCLLEVSTMDFKMEHSHFRFPGDAYAWCRKPHTLQMELNIVSGLVIWLGNQLLWYWDRCILMLSKRLLNLIEILICLCGLVLWHCRIKIIRILIFYKIRIKKFIWNFISKKI